jgi:hypothetical protein
MRQVAGYNHSWLFNKSPLAQSMGYSPDMSRLEVNRRRRKEAAAWLQQVTNCDVAADNDSEFRSTLADGVILCKVANILCPDSIKVITKTHWQGSPEVLIALIFSCPYKHRPSSLTHASSVIPDNTCYSS